mgnify:FL=1
MTLLINKAVVKNASADVEPLEKIYAKFLFYDIDFISGAKTERVEAVGRLLGDDLNLYPLLRSAASFIVSLGLLDFLRVRFLTVTL